MIPPPKGSLSSLPGLFFFPFRKEFAEILDHPLHIFASKTLGGIQPFIHRQWVFRKCLKLPRFPLQKTLGP